SFDYGMTAGRPVGVQFAHRTGDLVMLAHDAGIVFTPNGDYVIVLMTEVPENTAELVVPSEEPGLAPPIEAQARFVYDLQPAYNTMHAIAAEAYSDYAGAQADAPRTPRSLPRAAAQATGGQRRSSAAATLLLDVRAA